MTGENRGIYAEPSAPIPQKKKEKKKPALQRFAAVDTDAQKWIMGYIRHTYHTYFFIHTWLWGQGGH